MSGVKIGVGVAVKAGGSVAVVVSVWTSELGSEYEIRTYDFGRGCRSWAKVS